MLFAAPDRLGALNYILLTLGILSLGTAVEAWGKRHRAVAAERDDAPPAAATAPPAGARAPLLQEPVR